MRGIFLLVALIGAQALVADSALAKNGRNAAAAGGVAAGVVGGILLNQMLQQPAEAAPVYEEPPPVVYERAQPRYVAPAPARYEDPAFERMGRLRDACDSGSRRACVRFGMILGENRARERQWRRNRPDFYEWERW